LENSIILTATCERKLALQFSFWKLTAPLNGSRNGRARFKIRAHSFLSGKGGENKDGNHLLYS
jgi:hypothetical protein